jgi:ribonucleotide monophosphatase NagD (HAD superfamily)
MEFDVRPKTIIIDIDGTIIPHMGPNHAAKSNIKAFEEPLAGALDKFLEWDRKGYNIILLTGRKESMRANTESYLSSMGFFWDQLVMGVGGGPRILINDKKPNGQDAAFAINVERDKGLNDITV